MKKSETQEKLSTMFYSFMAEEEENNSSPVSAKQKSLIKLKETIETNKQFEKWVSFFRKTFLFLPGTFILYFATFAAIYFYSSIGFNERILFWACAGGFMVWAGLGSLKNIKHLSIPFSIVAFSVLLSFAFSFLPSSMKAVMFFQNSIYFFPLALIIPQLMKNCLTEKEKQSFY